MGYGAGLTFARRDLYFLTGVFTLKEAKSEDSVAVYLDVSYHIKPLRDIYTELNTRTLSHCTPVNTADLGKFVNESIKIKYLHSISTVDMYNLILTRW